MSVYTQVKIEEGSGKSRFISPYEKPLAEKPLTVRVDVELDKFVRSLPNRTEWLREAIAEKYRREQEASSVK